MARRAPPAPDAVTSLGVWAPGPLGDLVMATPAMNALAAALPRARRTLYTTRAGLELMAGDPTFDEVVLRGRAVRPTAREMRQRRHDLMVVLANSFRSALVARLSGARWRVGYAAYGRGWLLTHAVPRRRGRHAQDPAPMVETYLELLEEAGLDVPVTAPVVLHTSAAERRAAGELLTACGLAPDDVVVAVSPGAAYGSAKRWPAERFGEVARQLIEAGAPPVRVVVLAAPDETSVVEEMLAAVGPARERVISQHLPLDMARAILARAALHITNDTGSRHIGHALGTPTIAILGPTHAEWSSYPGQDADVLQVVLDCGPCMKRVCPLGTRRCMFDVEVERVLDVARRRLAESAP
jgi:heptosyltransferase-2